MATEVTQQQPQHSRRKFGSALKNLLRHHRSQPRPGGDNVDGEDSFIEEALHFPHNVKELNGVLKQKGVDPNKLNNIGNAPLHSLVSARHKKNKVKADLLYTFLTECDEEIDINQHNTAGNTALHLAVEMKDIEIVRILLAFGADINNLNGNQKTPLDFCLGQYIFMHRQDSFLEVAINKSAKIVNSGDQKDELVELLKACGGVRGKDIIHYSTKRKEKEVCHRLCLQREEEGFKDKEKIEFLCPMMADWCHSKAEMYHKYWSHVSQYPAPFSSEDLSKAADFGIQVKNLRLLQMAGSRVLVLDGGGMKGLVEIEILEQIERATKEKIVDLFDWIVGTSTGAVIALALVYARLPLSKIRQLFYKMKDPVFGSTTGLAYSTSSLTELLQSVFKGMTMSYRTYPRLIVSAVNKTNPNNLKLEFFGNHPDVDPNYGERLVWKVARYTSAAPIFFKELDNYVDGGVLANNPSSAALTVIQGMYSKQKIKIPISMLVSLGSGIMPEEELGKEDAKNYILFGRIRRMIDKASDLVSLLGNAITESEQVATDMSSRCKEQGINYFRCSPHLSHLVGSGEIDRDILMDAVLDAKRCSKNKRVIDTLILWFDACWSANEDLLRSGLLDH